MLLLPLLLGLRRGEWNLWHGRGRRDPYESASIAAEPAGVLKWTSSSKYMRERRARHSAWMDGWQWHCPLASISPMAAEGSTSWGTTFAAPQPTGTTRAGAVQSWGTILLHALTLARRQTNLLACAPRPCCSGSQSPAPQPPSPLRSMAWPSAHTYAANAARARVTRH